MLVPRPFLAFKEWPEGISSKEEFSSSVQFISKKWLLLIAITSSRFISKVRLAFDSCNAIILKHLQEIPVWPGMTAENWNIAIQKVRTTSFSHSSKTIQISNYSKTPTYNALLIVYYLTSVCKLTSTSHRNAYLQKYEYDVWCLFVGCNVRRTYFSLTLAFGL